jgi:hypothetical protein
VVAFIICAWVSAQLDQWDLYLALTLMLKSLLLIALSIVVVASCLLTLADIRALLLQVRQRVVRRSNV